MIHRKFIHLIAILFFIPSLAMTQTNSSDSNKVVFTALPYKIKYEEGRKLDKVPFKLKNNTQKKVTVKLVGAWLVRGKSFEPLSGAKMKLYYRNRYRKIDEIELSPGMSREIEVIFDAFDIYYGTQYSIRVRIKVGKETIDADCPVEMYKQHRNDPNKIK